MFLQGEFKDRGIQGCKIDQVLVVGSPHRSSVSLYTHPAALCSYRPAQTMTAPAEAAEDSSRVL